VTQEYAVDPEEPRGPTASLKPTTEARERPVQWLELFYDLVFAAAVVTFSHAISVSPSPVQIVVVVIAFDGVWMMWVATTLHANTFGVDDAVHRGLVLVQMLLLTVVAIAVGDGLRAEPQIVGGAFSLLTIDVAVMYARQANWPGPPGTLARRRRYQFLVATVPLLAGLAVSGWARDALWFASLGIIAVSTFGFRFGRVARAVDLDIPHLVERLGLLTIIMCGEAFVKVSLVAADGHLDGIDAVILVSLFVVIFSIWWAYFDDIPNAGLRDDTACRPVVVRPPRVPPRARRRRRRVRPVAEDRPARDAERRAVAPGDDPVRGAPARARAHRILHVPGTARRPALAPARIGRVARGTRGARVANGVEQSRDGSGRPRVPGAHLRGCISPPADQDARP
jgi:hypothetical protein